MRRRFVSRRLVVLGLSVASTLAAETFQRDQMAVPASDKVTVSRETYPGLLNPNPRGWYYKCANVVVAPDGSLVACFQSSDSHTSLTTNIMVARSEDGGKTWFDHRAIAHSDVWVDHAIWVVPQMSVLRDGRIVIVCDRGERTAAEGQPMLSDWQKPGRGMANYLLWSSDSGRTWTAPKKVDEIGGEPGYVFEQSDGTLAFTRTESARTKELRNPPAPWGDIYYRNRVVFSDDGGRTWTRTATLSDDPFHGDAEVGITELAPGRLLAATREGFGNGRFGQPSRLIRSEDGGRTWPSAVLAPFYGQRTHLGKLQSGKLLVTYRHVWGNPGTRALIFGADEKIPFQPSSWIGDENACSLTPEALALRTGEGRSQAIDFCLYPAQDDRARVEVDAKLRVEAADLNGCAISAGCWVRFLPGRVCLADRPAAGFAIDASRWHDYRVVREKGTVSVYADGEMKLQEPIDGIWVREVHFGNRAITAANDDYAHNRAVSFWRAVAVKVSNPNDYSIDWSWDPARGYPDQFRRDREVQLDSAYAADCGYSSWAQLPNGRIVIVDYTSGNLDSFTWGPVGAGAAPIVRAYLVGEADLQR